MINLSGNKILLSISVVFYSFAFIPRASAQNVNSSSSETEIHFNLNTRKTSKEIPFDKPFILIIDGLKSERVVKAFAYKADYIQGKRLPQELVDYLKEGKVKLTDFSTALTNGQAPLINPDLELVRDTSKQSIFFFPPIKPNTNFDVLVNLKASDASIKSALKVAWSIRKGNSDTQKLFDAFLTFFQDKTFVMSRSTTDYTSLQLFRSNLYKCGLDTVLAKMISKPNYGKLSSISVEDIKKHLIAADRFEINIPGANLLSVIDSKTMDNLSRGLLSLNSGVSADLLKEIDIPERLKNVQLSISKLEVIIDSSKNVYLRNTDSASFRVIKTSEENIIELKKSVAFLKTCYDEVKENIGDDTYESLWLVGNNDAKDLVTHGGSVLSTDVGLTNIMAFDNSNNFKYIPRLFIGLNIFFRKVDRNITLKDLPDDVAATDFLSTTKSWRHHWSLALGLTLGKIDESDFDNLYNSMSLTIGPSYRFAKAFRFSAGTALLKRLNPNPLHTNKRVTATGYLSFSVDFDLIQTAKNFTKLIF